MYPAPLTFTFVRNRLRLTWPDVAWGFDHGWFDANGVIEYAIARLDEDSGASSSVLQLAATAPQEFATLPILLKIVLAEAKEAHSSEPRRKWLFLALAWVYEHRSEHPDPLGVVEQLYAEFDYPEEIRNFIRYMPPADDYEPAAHTHSENISRLFENWMLYLTSFEADVRTH